MRDAAHLGGLQCLLGEGGDLFGELDDVDLFAAQLADDGLHAHALHADAGADRVDILVAAIMTAILVRSPASRAMARMLTVPS